MGPTSIILPVFSSHRSSDQLPDNGDGYVSMLKLKKRR